jgi:Tol biopolymer transport system component
MKGSITMTKPTTIVTSNLGKVLLVVTAIILVTATASLALHRFTPPFVQVTSLTSGEVGTLDAWAPDQWVFESNGDVIGNGNSTWQVFIFSLLERDLAGVSGLSQVTFGAHNARHPTMSRNGQFTDFRVAFEADGDLCADSANACDGTPIPVPGRQIFVYSTATQKITQITHASGDCVDPNISGNGRFIVFESLIDINGGGATGGITELYQADTNRLGSDCPSLPCTPPPGNPAAGTGVVRLTQGGGTHGVQSYNGLAVAFESRGDLLNGGANPGPQHIYVLAKGVLRQLTFGTAEDGRNPSINKNGTLIAYEQDTLPPSGPPVSQIFVTKARKKRVITTQVTQGAAPSHNPSLSANGRFLNFVSSADLLGNGTPEDQVYVYNIRRRLLTQLTAGPRGAQTTASTLFVLSAFTSDDDFKGNVVNPFRHAPKDFVTPQAGTPTPAATPGVPAEVVLSLVVNGAQSNGDGTLTTVVGAVVTDAYGSAVPDGTAVDFSAATPVNGVVVTDGTTNGSVACDVSEFEAQTGVAVTNEPGVAHGCVIYPADQAGTTRLLSASVVPSSGTPITASGTFTLPAAGPPPPPPAPAPTPTP